MATQQSTGQQPAHTRSTPPTPAIPALHQLNTSGDLPLPGTIAAPGMDLFRRADHYNRAEPRSLPFVEGNCLWKVPTFDETEDGLRAAQLFGYRAAAALFLHLACGGDDYLRLDEVAAAQKAPEPSLAVQCFWEYMTRLLMQYGFHVSAAQVSADLEAYSEQMGDFAGDLYGAGIKS